MASISSVDLELLRQLRVQIKERQDKLAAALTAGEASDFADYRHKVGQLKALSDMLDWGGEINDRLMGNEKGKAA